MNKRSAFAHRLWDALGPHMAELGFARASNVSCYRDRRDTTDVVGIEFFTPSHHRTWMTTAHSIGVVFGVFVNCAPSPFGRIERGADGRPEPRVHHCVIRAHLLRTLEQAESIPPNVWSIEGDLSNLDDVAADIRLGIETRVEYWFAQLRSIQPILTLLRHGVENRDGDPGCYGFGRQGSPIRNLYVGFLASAIGDYESAKHALGASMSKGGFEALSGSREVDEQVARKLADLDSLLSESSGEH